MSYVFSIIFAAIILVNLLWWLHVDRLSRAFPRAAYWRALLASFMFFQLGMVLWILGVRFLSLPISARPNQTFTSLVYLWNLLVLPSTLVLLVAGGRIEAIVQWLKKLSHKPRGMEGPSSPEGLLSTVSSRRQFLSMLAVASPPLITGLSTGAAFSQLEDFRIRPIETFLPSLPQELDGMRIAIVADLHVGTYTREAVLKRVVEETSKLNADLVLIPGDLINNTLSDLSAALDAVANIQSRHGSYLAIGNHDLIDNGNEFIRQAKARIPLLVGESAALSIRGYPVEILGLPWLSKDEALQQSVSSLAQRVARGAFPILMSHHPHAFDAAATAGLPLTISGHSHGGQLMVSESVGFGPLLFRYWSGLYQKLESNNSALVVSNGVGHWFPLRVGAPAEIIDLTLRRAV